MNETISTKYGFDHETIEKRSLNQKDGLYLNEIYDFLLDWEKLKKTK